MVTQQNGAMTPAQEDLIIAQAVASVKNRVTYYYDVPPELAARTGVAEVGLVKLTANEELVCSERAKTNAALGAELVKESLRYVDGKPLRTSDGSADGWWMDPKADPELRNLVASAYADLHNPKPEVVQTFLKSRRAKVG